MKLSRKFWFRLGAVLLLVLLGAVMMIIGRGHTLYFDNKTLETGSAVYAAPYRIDVHVKNNEDSNLYSRERGMATIMGQSAKVELSVTQSRGGEAVKHVYNLKVPYGLDGIVINLPALLAGTGPDVYMSEFVSLATTVETEAAEEVITDEFSMGDI